MSKRTIALLAAVLVLLTAAFRLNMDRQEPQHPASSVQTMDTGRSSTSPKPTGKAPAAKPVQKPAPKPKPVPPPAEEEPEEETYIINRNTGKFHYPYCYSVDRMKESNKRYFTGTREELIAGGYSPCGNCDP